MSPARTVYFKRQSVAEVNGWLWGARRASQSPYSYCHAHQVRPLSAPTDPLALSPSAAWRETSDALRPIATGLCLRRLIEPPPVSAHGVMRNNIPAQDDLKLRITAEHATYPTSWSE